MNGLDSRDRKERKPMKRDRPNILLIMTDQQRGDCLGVEGRHPVLTPNLDGLAAEGMRFARAYSTCPVCIPARRSLLSGQHPSTHGLLGYKDGVEWSPAHTLPSVLRDAGYQTYLAGRSMHQYPHRKRFGYEEMAISEDYGVWLQRQLPVETFHNPYNKYGNAIYSTGVMHNDWTSRPWPYDEALHFTNWTVHEARRFLERRDPSCPFFLTVSFLAPHPPLLPPPFYMERYLRNDLPKSSVGDWATPPAGVVQTNGNKVKLEGEIERSCKAGYYGSINHIDDQLRRLVYSIHGIDGFRLDDTIVVFTSDHGEMLGDHYFWRKSLPYEGAARIPLLFRVPEQYGFPSGLVSDQPVCLEDIMPTLLELAGVPIPDSVDGISLVPQLRGDGGRTREHVHIEHAGKFHALTDGREKYIWWATNGSEQLFDLEADPEETRDLARDAGKEPRLAAWRSKLTEVLRHRPERFVQDGRLVAGVSYPVVMER